ncbi:hypothetical protein GGH93_001174 [Coemansia aciculifera]|nr:hypothetical protein GGH93_001174 [Coemansia aciculifera]
MSGNDRRNNHQASDAAQQAENPLDESLSHDQAQVDRLWQRIIATMREAGDHATNATNAANATNATNSANAQTQAQSLRRYARPARLGTRPNAQRTPAHAPTPPEGWHFVPDTDLFPSSSPPRSRRRVMRVTRRREPTSSSLTDLLATQRLHLSQLISTAGSAWLHRSDNNEEQPATREFEPPVIQGPIVDFDDISYDDVDDFEEHIESDGGEAQMMRWEEERSSFEDWQTHNFLGQTPLHLLDDERPPRAARLQSSSRTPSTTGAHSSVIVRQPWNTDHAWSPYIYQEPVPNSALGGLRATYQGAKDHTLPGTGLERSRLYSMHSSIAELRLNYLSTNDDYTRSGSHPRNMLRTSTAFYTTASRSNVHIELCFEPDRHCVVERIFVQAPTSKPRCTELMVFASNRRCSLEELSKYDDFTFAQYEMLAQDIKSHPDHLPDPMPIAYFWLAYEDRYKQIQILPRGVTCKHLYVVMLRGDRVNQAMGLQTFRVYGWSGARAFSEVTIC